MNLKYLKLSAIALAFLSVGCSTQSPEVSSKWNTTQASSNKWNASQTAVIGERGEPARYQKFSSILKASKLQISTPNAKPGSKKEIATNSNFSGIVDENFYVDKASKAFVFKMEGYKLRNELRVKKNFKSNDSNTFHHLSSELLLVNPQESVKDSELNRREITVLQVHNKGTTDSGDGYIPHPLLRVVWLEERQGIRNHYWAVIKNNALNCKKAKGITRNPACSNSYDKVDLGAASATQPSKFDIIVGGEKLVIKMNGETKVDHSLDYWTHMLSYFKAGVYNQFKNGQSEAHFYELDYVVENR